MTIYNDGVLKALFYVAIDSIDKDGPIPSNFIEAVELGLLKPNKVECTPLGHAVLKILGYKKP